MALHEDERGRRDELLHAEGTDIRGADREHATECPDECLPLHVFLHQTTFSS